MNNYLRIIVCLLVLALSHLPVFSNQSFGKTNQPVDTGSSDLLDTGENSQNNRILPGVMMMLMQKPAPVLSVTPATQTVGKSSVTTTLRISNVGTGIMAWTAAVTSGSSWLAITSGSSGSNTGVITCGYSTNTGTLPRTATIRITAAGVAGSPADATVTQAVGCGAYVAPGVWKVFDCYNLAAIGKTTADDPFTPSWRLIGGYWQWGRKGPDSSLWHTTDTENFAHGPTGPDPGAANDGAITGWDTTNAAPDGSWSDGSKTASDPCPAGFRVPASTTHWEGIIANNTQSIVGSWSDSPTNYSSARFFGNDLMLPAAGFRTRLPYSPTATISDSAGSLTNRGLYGLYWSDSQYLSGDAWGLYFGNTIVGTYHYPRTEGFSVRCVAE